MAGPRRELAIAHRQKLAPEGVAGERKRKLIPYPLRQIGKPPAHHAMCRGDRPWLHNRRKPGAVLIVQDRTGAFRVATPSGPVSLNRKTQ